MNPSIEKSTKLDLTQSIQCKFTVFSRGRSSYRGRGRSHYRHDRIPNIPMVMPQPDYNQYQQSSMPPSGYDDGQYHLPPRYAMFDFIKLFILCIDRSKFDRFVIFGLSVRVL